MLHVSPQNPILQITVDCDELAAYDLGPLLEGPDPLYLHTTVRLLRNRAMMIDGLLSNHSAPTPQLDEPSVRGVRFQPFFIGPGSRRNAKLVGQGLFYRGLHFPGTITPSNVYLSCLCDRCRRGFTLQCSHTGFGNSQYFYSDSGSETLIIPLAAWPDVPGPLQKPTDPEALAAAEARLPRSPTGSRFRYLNPFRCPYCTAPYIDFERFPEIRPTEYYAAMLVPGPTA